MRLWEGEEIHDTRLFTTHVTDLTDPSRLRIQHEFYLACRLGDLSRARHLVEIEGAIVNIHDESDASPLYYASLCGHEQLILYLLEKGARCEENTFDGERCLYAALTDNIRRVLKREGFKLSSRARDPLLDFFTKSFEAAIQDNDSHPNHPRDNGTEPGFEQNEDPQKDDHAVIQSSRISDISFLVHKQFEMHLHRWIIGARCSYLRNRMMTTWKEKRNVSLGKAALDPDAIVAFFRYLYTGRLQIQTSSVDSFCRLCRQCNMDGLANLAFSEYAKARPDANWLVSYPSTAKAALQRDLQILVDCALSPKTPPAEYFFDMKIIVGDEVMYCHKMLWCCKSPYLDLIYKRSDTVETYPDSSSSTNSSSDLCSMKNESQPLKTIEMHKVSPSIMRNIIEYLYLDTIALDNLCSDELITLLETADIMLLSHLKSFCATIIIQHIDHENVFSLINAARLYNIPRLEDHCVMYVALQLDEFLDNIELHELLKESAASIRQRQELDSVPIADDMKNFIHQKYRHLDETFHEDGDVGYEVVKMEMDRRDMLLHRLRELLQMLQIGVKTVETLHPSLNLESEDQKVQYDQPGDDDSEQFFSDYT
eukprot:TRINITY_DN12770_c0_g1_i1.p1 TRINITY_DN12770_c0_g1~~TRINITY_DN12770_c0_g1_i1.p1  ORF type:complete len:596 (-),score=103.06 TRINITY_DN12770_c0_g1_i1:181-1968(-)